VPRRREDGSVVLCCIIPLKFNPLRRSQHIGLLCAAASLSALYLHRPFLSGQPYQFPPICLASSCGSSSSEFPRTLLGSNLFSMGHTSKDLLQLERKNSSTSPLGLSLFLCLLFCSWLQIPHLTLCVCLCFVQSLRFLFAKKTRPLNPINPSLMESPSLPLFPKAKVPI
jgi:hypothetical protein